MRLIDADAFVPDIASFDGDDWHYGYSEKQIENAPTIDAVEVVHGEWIKMSDADGYYYCCNMCGEELPRYMTELPSWDKPYPHKHSIDKTDFCPNCGAKMDGERRDPCSSQDS